MPLSCPSCKQDTRLTRVPGTETIPVRGELIPVEVERYQCLACGTQFPDPAFDPQAAALREYRRRRGMLQREQIRALRQEYGLSQRELSGLLGFGGATLSRYENGALQDDAHDALLRLAREPENMLRIVERDRDSLDPGKRAELTGRLRWEAGRAGLIRLIGRGGLYAGPNPFNGERALDLKRLANAVKILCFRADVPRTRLNRLLFYADFKHYQREGRGITGLGYLRLPSGPAPDSYEVVYHRMAALDPDLTAAEDPTLEEDRIVFRCEQEPDRTLISFDELRTLIEVDAFFKTHTSAMLCRFALGEDGVQRTAVGELISYEHARRLRI